MSIGAAVLFAWILGDLMVDARWRELRWRNSPWRLYLELSGALILAIAVSLVAAALFPLSYSGHSVLVQSITELGKTWYFVWPPLVAWALSRLDRTQQNQILSGWLVFACLLGVVGIQQYWTGWPRPQIFPRAIEAPIRYHATLFLGHHLSVASVFIFPFFVGLDRLKERPRIWLAVGLLAIGGTLFLTFSRTLWVGMAVGLLFWALASLPRRWSMTALGAVGLIALLMIQSSVVRERLYNSMGVEPRLELWAANWEFFKQRPLTGVGWLKNEELAGYFLQEKHPGREIFVGRAHNNILEILAQLGILGFAAWACWSLWITIRFWRVGRSGQWGILTAWVVFQINGLTQVNQWEGKVMHQLCWVLAWSGVWWAQRSLKKSKY